mmetsp:Transcript_4009/g.5827  ORF Transcript_4009/g.5827 Transcript_4009/m.5827 type:complete len:213 (+) Transcript_4009:695-1333(+)
MHHERIAIRNNLSPQRPPTAGIVAVDNARHIGVFTVAVVEGRRKVRLVSHRDILVNACPALVINAYIFLVKRFLPPLIIFAIPTVAIRMFTSAFFFAPWGIPMTRAIPALHNLGLLTKFWVIVIPRNSIFIEIAPEVLPAIVPLAFFDAIIIEGGRQQGVALIIICVFTIPILFNCVMVRPLVMVGPARIKFIRSPPKGNVPRKRPVLLVDE